MSAPVLQVISSTARRGAEIFAVDLADGLRARGRAVETVALTASPSASTLDVPVLGERSLGVSTLRALRGRIASASAVISYGSRSLPACAIASVGTGTPFVYRSIGDVVSYAASRSRRARVSLYLRRTTAVVALWPAAARALTSRHRVPAGKITVIPRGVPAARFAAVDPARRAAARAELGVPQEVPVALFLGALIRDKDPDAAIDAVASRSDVHLLVAGDGPERARIEARAQQQLPGRAHFLGVVADPAAVLAAATVLVLPSLTEGMPGVAIEAGLSGLPVVATDVGAVREVVLDGVTGVVVAPRDAEGLGRGLGRALGAAPAMGPKAREHCLRHFEIGVVSDAWDRLLGDLERGGARARRHD